MVIVQIAVRNQLVEIFQTRLVLDKQNLMIGAEFFGVGTLCHLGHELLVGTDACGIQILKHAEADGGQHGGIVRRTVVIEVTKAVMLGHGVQLVVLEVGQQVTSQGKGIHIRIFKGQAATLGGGTDKARIKIGVMRDQGHLTTVLTLAEECKKCFQCFPLGGCTLDHIVGNARELDDIGRNGALGVNEGLEGVQNLSVADAHRTDLGNAAGKGRETSGLNIKDHGGVLQTVRALTVNRTCGVIDEVCLHAPDDLLADLLGGQHGILISLHVSVVGNRHGRVSPLLRLLDEVRGRNQGVHRGHLSMYVQLHTLDGGVILALDAADLGDGVMVEQKIRALGAVATNLALGVAAQGDHRTVLDHRREGIGILGEHIGATHLNGGGVIGHVKGNIELISLPCGLLLEAKYLAQNDQSASGAVNGRDGGGEDVKLPSDRIFGRGNIKLHKADLHAAILHVGGVSRAGVFSKK